MQSYSHLCYKITVYKNKYFYKLVETLQIKLHIQGNKIISPKKYSAINVHGMHKTRKIV